MDGLIAILCAVGLPVVFLALLLFGRRKPSSPPARRLTREEKARDAIAGEVWRQM